MPFIKEHLSVVGGADDDNDDDGGEESESEFLHIFNESKDVLPFAFS